MICVCISIINTKYWQSQMTRIFGVDDEFGEDAILGKLEAMRDIIEQVNRQFKDPVSAFLIMVIYFYEEIILYPLIVGGNIVTKFSPKSIGVMHSFISCNN